MALHDIPACNYLHVHLPESLGAVSDSVKLSKAERVHALKEPCASHSSEIALAGSRRLRSTLAAAPVIFTHAVVTVAETK